MSQQKTIIIRDDRMWKSIIQDVISAGSLLALVGVGLWLESSALQWIGGIIWMLWLVGWLVSLEKGSKKTIKEAREYLDGLEGGE